MAQKIEADRVDPPAGSRWVAPRLVEHVDGSWHLIGSRCIRCGSRFFPSATVCAACLSDDLARVSLPKDGRLYSSTTIKMAPPGFGETYRVAWVDLEELRVFGQLIGCDDEPAVGDRVEVAVAEIRRDPDGTPVYGHAFRHHGGV